MVAGYEILPVNVLVPFAAWLSWEHLATLMYLLATGLFVATMCLIVLPESRWGGFGVRSAFALVLALTPVDPETFGVLLYGFWWISLWPMIILGWRGTRYRLRVPLLVLASLSSPAAGTSSAPRRCCPGSSFRSFSSGRPPSSSSSRGAATCSTSPAGSRARSCDPWVSSRPAGCSRP